MIVRNEAEHLPNCIKSVKDFVDDIIIVDTGSTDGTIDIARNLGAQVEAFEWCDDFSAARNYALSFVRSPWTLWLDADDIVLNPEVIPGLTEEARKKRVNGIWSIYRQDASCYQRRLQIFKTKDYQWQGVVHENPIPKNHALASAFLSDLVVLHRKPKERGPQAARKYLDILLEKDPENWLGIAESYKYLSVYPDSEMMQPVYENCAQEYYWKAFNHPQVNDGTKYLALFNGAQLALKSAKTNTNALEWAMKQAQLGVGMMPHRAECWVILGQCWQALDHKANALEAYETALRQEPPLDTIGVVYHAYYDEIPRKLIAALREEAKRVKQEKSLIWTP